MEQSTATIQQRGLIALIIAGASFLIGCTSRTDGGPPRFEVIESGRGHQVFKDRQTGKEYLTRYSGGIIEIEPTKYQGG